MSKLVLKNVARRYGAVEAVADFSLELQPGEFVSLLGPSGCGKTTTLRMIAGFMPPSEGTIEMDGEVISSPSGVVPPERRRMSMIFQSYAIWPNMTVGENVGFGLQVRKLPRAEIERRVDQDPRRRADARPEGSLSGRAVGRPAAACRLGARHRGRAGGPAARRAAVQSRRQPARGDALRDPPPARRVQDHHGLCHARPVRGHGDVRPHRGDEQGPHRADRSAAGPVRPAQEPLRRGLHRPHQLRRARRRRPFHSGRNRSACRSPSRRPTASRPRSSTVPISASTGITR